MVLCYKLFKSIKEEVRLDFKEVFIRIVLWEGCFIMFL